MDLNDNSVDKFGMSSDLKIHEKFCVSVTYSYFSEKIYSGVCRKQIDMKNIVYPPNKICTQ